jgi:hypothetical protein
MTSMRGGFHLIGAAMEVTVPLPIRISETLRIEKPNEEQMGLLRSGLQWFDIYGDARQHFETIASRQPSGGGSVTIHRTQLPENEQRYLLLTFYGTGNDAIDFFMAARLVLPTLWTLFHVYTKDPFGVGGWAGHGADTLAYQRQMMEWVKGDPHPILDAAAISRVTDSYAALCRLNREAHPGARRAVEMFDLFARMPLMQVFDVLAMFMLIEMLLTHNPNDKEIGDSLTHQVCNKVPFVFERMGSQIDYSVFGVADRDRIWRKLYAYRSAIAHGEIPKFASDLQVLRDAETANRFLTDVTRRLIRFSLDDPGLFEGLKPL